MTDSSEVILAALHARIEATGDKAIKQAIMNELAEGLPALEAVEDQAEAAYRETCTALGKPEQKLADLDAEKERVTGQCAEWQAKLSSLRAEDRVEARVRFQAWTDELDQVQAKRDQAERDLQPYYQARNKATADLEHARKARLGLACAMVMPYESRVAQGTRAYVTLRQPRLGYVLLAGDRTHPEWECAVAQFEDMRRVVEQTPAEAAAMMTAAMGDAAAAVADPVPSAADVLAMDKATFANEVLQQHPSQIEDHRITPPLPRNPPPRDWMQLPGRGAR